MMKTCSKCKKNKHISKFYNNYSYCRACTKLVKKKFINKNYKIIQDKKQKLIDYLKINGCAICGYNRCSYALDFHHVNPSDKDFRITKNHMDFKDERIVNEINKCILLCKNCHFEIHYKGGVMR